MDSQLPSQTPNNDNMITPPKRRGVRIALIISGLAVLAFLFIALTFPVVRNQLFSILFEKDPGFAGGVTPPSCPAGTTLLFSQSGSLNVGDSVSFGGTVSSVEDSWSVESEDGVLMAEGGEQITVTFPNQVSLKYALIYDNDPKSGENPWSINGVNLPTTDNNEWAPLFHLNLVSNQMTFDHGDDSPHFNICGNTTQTTPSPTPTRAITPTPTPEGSHLECQNFTCVEVPGTGENQCSNDLDCQSPTNTPTPSPTPTIEITPTPTTPIPTPTSGHLVCENNACVAVSGEGGNECVSDADCQPSPSPTLTSTPTPTPTGGVGGRGDENLPTSTPLATSLPDTGVNNGTIMLVIFGILSLGVGNWIFRKETN